MAEQYVVTPNRKRFYEVWDVNTGYVLVPQIPEEGWASRSVLPESAKKVGRIKAISLESARERLLERLHLHRRIDAELHDVDSRSPRPTAEQLARIGLAWSMAGQYVATPNRKRVYEVWDVTTGYVLVPEIPEEGRISYSALPTFALLVGRIKAVSLEAARERLLRRLEGGKYLPKKPYFNDLQEL